MAEILFNMLTSKFKNAKDRVDALDGRIKRADPGEDIELLQKRLDKARENYDSLESRLAKYISYIPGERTKECMRLAYLENWSKERLSDYYHIAISVITRELVYGRQIITALEKFDNDKT